MGLTNLWSSRKKGGPVSQSEVSLEGLLSEYDLLHVEDEPGKQFAVVASKPQDLGREVGTSSPSPFTSFTRQEYNPALQGLRGLEAFDKMRKSDGTVRGTLRSIKTPALSGRWFVEPAEDSDEAREVAAWVWRNLTELMSISWPQVLTEALLMADFGYYMFEKVWDFRVVDGKLRTVLTKLGPRHPMDVKAWEFDAHGGPAAVHMYKADMSGAEDSVPIEIDKLLVFTFDREAGNVEGISVLRTAYKHWYFKEQLYKIDAIQKERHGIGIPVIKLPMGYKDKDRLIAEELGRNIRTNERAHIVLPPGWEITMLKLEGQPVNSLESIEHHNGAIRENILVNFIGEHAREEDLVMFLKASRFIADIVAETFNTYLIPQMVRYNFNDVDRMPRLRVRRIGESADWRTLSFALRNLIGAGVIIPDDDLEANLREEMDLPMFDRDSARLVATPQNPFDVNEDMMRGEDDVDDRVGEDEHEGDQTRNRNNPNYNRRPRGRKKRNAGLPKVGMPRQTPVGNAKNSFGLPRSNGGSDRSGG